MTDNNRTNNPSLVQMDALTADQDDNKMGKAELYWWRFGDVFGDGSDPLSRWVFVVAALANDAGYTAELFNRVGSAITDAMDQADSLYLLRLGISQAYEGCKLLFKPHPSNIADSVNAILESLAPAIVSDVNTLRAAHENGNGVMHPKNVLANIRHITYHYESNPARNQAMEGVWVALSKLEDRKATSTIKGSRYRHTFVDETIYAMIEDSLQGRPMTSLFSEIFDILERLSRIVTAIIIEYVKEVKRAAIYESTDA